jgi:hypothetical protein
LYGDTPAAGFGPLAIKAVRQRFIATGWGRKTVNARVDRVRRVFKWATAEELVPVAVYTALAAVPGLQKGRSLAPESEPVEPVADEVVDATLPLLNRHVRGLVEFERLSSETNSQRPQCQPEPVATVDHRAIAEMVTAARAAKDDKANEKTDEHRPLGVVLGSLPAE